MSTPKPKRPLIRLTVESKEELTPSMLRIRFHAPAFQDNGMSDAYLKFILGPDGPLLEDLPERPTTRTYTVRAHDPAAGTVTVDFLTHGEAGLAAPWARRCAPRAEDRLPGPPAAGGAGPPPRGARRCAPGDEILARGPGGKWSPRLDADFHLFVGDEAALPAIEAGLERLPDDARGLVLVEADRHTRTLTAPEGVEARWIVRDGAPYREERLAEEVAALPWDELGDVSVFAHGERGAVKQLRRVMKDREVPAERLSISGYWALGRIEDQFQAEKRLPIGKI